MNRIEERLSNLKNRGEKAFVTYMTAGLPSFAECINIIKAQDEAGIDVIELGIPFSDPIADGPLIQAASIKAISQGVTLEKVFEMMKELRKDCQVPIVFMMYYNTINHYGIKKFVETCAECGVDGVIIPDVPYEESFEIKEYLNIENAPILIPMVGPISGDRIPMLLKDTRGFVYSVSSMGVTGQDAAFHKNTLEYLDRVKKASKIPVMLGFGIREFADVKPFINEIDGCVVGTHFIKIMQDSNYNLNVIKNYIKTFKSEMNAK